MMVLVVEGTTCQSVERQRNAIQKTPGGRVAIVLQWL